jgi:hypothetical protein
MRYALGVMMHSITHIMHNVLMLLRCNINAGNLEDKGRLGERGTVKPESYGKPRR